MTSSVKAPAAPAHVKPVAQVAVTDAKTRKPRQARVDVDFSAVQVVDGGAVRKDPLAGTPVVGWVRDSRSNGNKAKTVVIPTPAVDTIQSLIRLAAARDDHGVSFGKPVGVKDRPGYSALPFAAKDKNTRKPKEAATA